jgi:hypothetical protein|tara:strand:- start:22 stop:372 length:351 start_codon:yes stop_codon:yes gene_type:complete
MQNEDLVQLYEDLWRQNNEDRRNAFALHGVGHFNYNSVLLHRQVVEQGIKDKERRMAEEVVDVIYALEKMSSDSIKIAEFGRVIVEINPKLAEALEFILSVELQEKHRRETDANKI